MKIFKNTVFVGGGRTRHRFLTWNNPFDFFMYTACGLMLVSFIRRTYQKLTVEWAYRGDFSGFF